MYRDSQQKAFIIRDEFGEVNISIADATNFVAAGPLSPIADQLIQLGAWLIYLQRRIGARQGLLADAISALDTAGAPRQDGEGRQLTPAERIEFIRKAGL